MTTAREPGLASKPSPTPRWDNAQHVDVAVHSAIADLVVQVARIANALEYQLGIQPTDFPDTSNTNLYGSDQA